MAVSLIETSKAEECRRQFDLGPARARPWRVGGKLGAENIVGVATGKKISNDRVGSQDAVIFLVREKPSHKRFDKTMIEPAYAIPPLLKDGSITDVIAVGLNSLESFQVHCGMTIGKIPGTGGCLVEGRTNGSQTPDRFLLSAGHVLAPEGRWTERTEVHWAPPGLSSRAKTFIGHVAQVSALDRSAPKSIDAGIVALAESSIPIAPEVACHTQKPLPNLFGKATVPSRVRKCGAVTGLTFGSVHCVDACGWVRYPNHPAGWIFLENQILILDDQPGASSGFAAPGDSGAVVVEDSPTGPVVGLLVAGSVSRGAYFANPIDAVLDSFKGVRDLHIV